MSIPEHVDPATLIEKLMKMTFSVRKTSAIKSQNRPHRLVTLPKFCLRNVRDAKFGRFAIQIWQAKRA